MTINAIPVTMQTKSNGRLAPSVIVWDETAFTVAWAGLDANSPYTHTYYSNIAIGDASRYERLTSPSGSVMTMTGTGKFNMDPVSLVIETFDQQIYDLSLNTYLPASTVTIHP